MEDWVEPASSETDLRVSGFFENLRLEFREKWKREEKLKREHRDELEKWKHEHAHQIAELKILLDRIISNLSDRIESSTCHASN